MEKFLFKSLLALVLTFVCSCPAISWGFFAHKHINRLAVFTLPAEMAVFYKRHIDLITEGAVMPDKRRYIVPEEGARHYIDLDYYRDSLEIVLPLSWDSIQSKVTSEMLQKHGILPWHLYLMKLKLTEAFRMKDAEAIVRLSADMGHYVGDAHVPLHTCSNYNGQHTGQHGIHGLWETRLPELNFEGYDFFVGPASYIRNPYQTFWEVVEQSNAAVDSVLSFERVLTSGYPGSRKYAYEERGNSTVRVYSREFSLEYHQLLDGQVERRMRQSVKMVGNIWLTCWVDAGQPDLSNLYVEKQKAVKEKDEGVVEDHKECSH